MRKSRKGREGGDRCAEHLPGFARGTPACRRPGRCGFTLDSAAGDCPTAEAAVAAARLRISSSGLRTLPMHAVATNTLRPTMTSRLRSGATPPSRPRQETRRRAACTLRSRQRPPPCSLEEPCTSSAQKIVAAGLPGNLKIVHDLKQRGSGCEGGCVSRQLRLSAREAKSSRSHLEAKIFRFM